MSHVFVIDAPDYPRPLFVTDAAINIYPTLEDKVDIVQNAIDLAHALGLERPKVAILSAVEIVTSKIKSTIDAAALCKMADRGQITGGILDGRSRSLLIVGARGQLQSLAGQEHGRTIPLADITRKISVSTEPYKFLVRNRTSL